MCRQDLAHLINLTQINEQLFAYPYMRKLAVGKQVDRKGVLNHEKSATPENNELSNDRFKHFWLRG